MGLSISRVAVGIMVDSPLNEMRVTMNLATDLKPCNKADQHPQRWKNDSRNRTSDGGSRHGPISPGVKTSEPS